MRRYPLGPFFELTGWTMRQVSVASGCSHPNGIEYRRRIEHGVTALVADRIATAAGFHPAEIWPSWWDDALDDEMVKKGRPCEQCGEPFVASRSWSLYCSPRCKGAAKARRRYHARPDIKAKTLARSKAYKDAHPEYIARLHRRYYEAHREALIEYQRNYRKAKAGEQLPVDPQRPRGKVA